MTEAEWLACDNPEKMVEFCRGKVSDRKLRLFAVACCRRLWNLLTDDRSVEALDICEKYVEGVASRRRMEIAHAVAAEAVAATEEEFRWMHFAAVSVRECSCHRT